MAQFSDIHRVLIHGPIHAYMAWQQETLCGIDKRHYRRVYADTGPVTCPRCIDAARAHAIRTVDYSIGLDY